MRGKDRVGEEEEGEGIYSEETAGGRRRCERRRLPRGEEWLAVGLDEGAVQAAGFFMGDVAVHFILFIFLFYPPFFCVACIGGD